MEAPKLKEAIVAVKRSYMEALDCSGRISSFHQEKISPKEGVQTKENPSSPALEFAPEDMEQTISSLS